MAANDQQDIPPNRTVYIHNLNEKVKKEEMRKCLYALFSQFGPILDVVAQKTLRMRGQAFVAFKEISSASAAIKRLSGYSFFDKPLKLTYSKNTSDIVAKMEGSFEKQDRSQKRVTKDNEKKRKAEEAAEGTPQAKRQETIPTPAPAPVPVAEVAPPNKLLFVQNLPDNMTKNMLEMLFQKYPGLKEVRLVAGKAFVEFDHEINATTAMMGYNGFKVSEDRAMVISYARA